MWWTVGAIFGMVGVALGAFGAHGLALEGDAAGWWDTAARYHLVHALAICAVAAHPRTPAPAGVAFAAGIALFSGSLYTMALTELRWLGAVTPLGGLCFLAGWIALAAHSSRAETSTSRSSG